MMFDNRVRGAVPVILDNRVREAVPVICRHFLSMHNGRGNYTGFFQAGCIGYVSAGRETFDF